MQSDASKKIQSMWMTHLDFARARVETEGTLVQIRKRIRQAIHAAADDGLWETIVNIPTSGLANAIIDELKAAKFHARDIGPLDQHTDSRPPFRPLLTRRVLIQWFDWT